MKQSIQLRLGQHLSMTPQLQQAIKLLQLSNLQLQQEIQAQLESNFMLMESDEGELSQLAEDTDPRLLHETSPEPTARSQELAADREVRAESNEMPDELPVDTRWDDVYENYLPSGSQGGDDHADFDPFSQQSRPESLHDHLIWQLNLARLSARDEVIALAVIDAIDENGYLRADCEDLVAALRDPSVTAEEVIAVIHRVQSFDPAGVGARDLRECLLLQLRLSAEAAPASVRELAIAICERGFDYLPRNDVSALARLLVAPETAIHAALNLIRQQNPRPGSLIAEIPVEYVVPEVFVRRIGGTWRAELNPETTPKLRINADYARLIRRNDQSTDSTVLKSHLQEARWFIKSLISRNDTVLRVASKIVELQQEFFEHGDDAMKPLILRDISEALDLHESTISRVTTQKYMHTPRGTVEFKYFFSSHLSTTSGGECSSTAIRSQIRRMIAEESARKPLSDSRIAHELAEQGINVARRTVAKYREAMGIPPSNERKRLA
jgi:RNA polymerase sigma-54 factor